MVECIRCGVYVRDDTEQWLGKWCQECWEHVGFCEPLLGPVVHWEYEPLVPVEERVRQFKRDWYADRPAYTPGVAVIL